MRIFPFLSLLLALSFSLTLPSCNNSDDDGIGICGDDFFWGDEVEDELEDYLEAAQDYTADPTPANCNALKDAFDDYIDALEDINDCVGAVNRDAYRRALQDARDARDTIC